MLTPEQRKTLINQPFPTFAYPHEEALLTLPGTVRARLVGAIVYPTSYKWAGTIVGDRFFGDNEHAIGRGRQNVESDQSVVDLLDLV